METIKVIIEKADAETEVAKATDYTGSKLTDGDDNARDRILAVDEDFAELSRFWDESALAINERFKDILVKGEIKESHLEMISGTVGETLVVHNYGPCYVAELEVSKSFDKTLADSVKSTLRSYFIASIIGQWFKFANKSEAGDYLLQAAEFLDAAERLIYSRRKPRIPNN